MFKYLFPTTLAVIAGAAPAAAHGGHLGELAGHSHWVGVAAALGAAALAAALGARLKGKAGVDGEGKAADAEVPSDEEAEAARG